MIWSFSLLFVLVGLIVNFVPTSPIQKVSFAPSFDHPGISYVMATEGQTTYFNCSVHNIGKKTVTWVRYHNDHIELLTYGLVSFHDDKRFIILFESPTNWKLRISPAKAQDSGRYECQISTHPPTVKTVFLTVQKPKITLRDDQGHPTARYLYGRVGGHLRLECHLAPTSVYTTDLPFWTLNGTRLRPKVVDNVRVEGVRLDESFSHWLSVDPLLPSNEGEYGCRTKGSRGREVIVILMSAANTSSKNLLLSGHQYGIWCYLVVLWLLFWPIDK